MCFLIVSQVESALRLLKSDFVLLPLCLLFYNVVYGLLEGNLILLIFFLDLLSRFSHKGRDSLCLA